MGSVLHFMSDCMEKPACGANVFLCSDYTDDPRYVDCQRCRRTKAFINFDPIRYDVDVFNYEGDVVRWFRRVTADEVDGIREDYSDNPAVTVSVAEAWEVR